MGLDLYNSEKKEPSGAGEVGVNLQWRAADADVSALAWGFIERHNRESAGAALHFPVAYPVLQVTLAGRYRVELGSRLEATPTGGLWGSAFEAVRGAPEGSLHSFAAALTFEGAALLLGGPPSLAANQILDLDALRPCASANLVERVTGAASFEARVRIVQDFFRGLAARTSPRHTDPRILALSTEIARDVRGGPVGRLANVSGSSERTLYNRVRREIGCGPKRLLRLARLQRLLRAFHPAPFGGKPAVDPLLEFVDEAHIRREFRALTGMRPSDFESEKRRSGDPVFHSIGADAGAIPARPGR